MIRLFFKTNRFLCTSEGESTNFPVGLPFICRTSVKKKTKKNEVASYSLRGRFRAYLRIFALGQRLPRNIVGNRLERGHGRLFRRRAFAGCGRSRAGSTCIRRSRVGNSGGRATCIRRSRRFRSRTGRTCSRSRREEGRAAARRNRLHCPKRRIAFHYRRAQSPDGQRAR